MIGETQLRSTIVEKIKANDAAARAHRRIRYPRENRIAEFIELLRDDNNLFNAYMVRRLQRSPKLKGISNRLAAVEYVYEIRFYFGVVDDDDDAVASEEKAQAKIDSLAALFDADPDLGLGGTVSHSGLDLPTDFEDRLIGDWLFHRADMRLRVKVANINC